MMTLPNMVFSFFGMNVPLAFASSEHSFIIILFITFSFIGLISLLIIKKRWL
jgi:Mg2+ and Co2+ transporter CorA